MQATRGLTSSSPGAMLTCTGIIVHGERPFSGRCDLPADYRLGRPFLGISRGAEPIDCMHPMANLASNSWPVRRRAATGSPTGWLAIQCRNEAPASSGRLGCWPRCHRDVLPSGVTLWRFWHSPKATVHHITTPPRPTPACIRYALSTLPQTHGSVSQSVLVIGTNLRRGCT